MDVVAVSIRRDPRKSTMWRDSTIVRTATQHTDTDTIYRRYIVTFTRIWPGNTAPMFAYYYVSPLYTEGETYRFTSHRSFLCHICFVSVRSVLSVYYAGGQTRDVDPMSGYCWPTVYGAEPALAQYWVTVSCLTPRCIWASVIDEGPTLTQLLFKSSWGITASMK